MIVEESGMEWVFSGMFKVCIFWFQVEAEEQQVLGGNGFGVAKLTQVWGFVDMDGHGLFLCDRFLRRVMIISSVLLRSESFSMVGQLFCE